MNETELYVLQIGTPTLSVTSNHITSRYSSMNDYQWNAEV